MYCCCIMFFFRFILITMLIIDFKLKLYGVRVVQFCFDMGHLSIHKFKILFHKSCAWSFYISRFRVFNILFPVFDDVPTHYNTQPT